jgi:hypothetical protein
MCGLIDPNAKASRAYCGTAKPDLLKNPYLILDNCSYGQELRLGARHLYALCSFHLRIGFKMTKEFELARLHMVNAGRAEEIDRSRAYAWAHRIYPLDPRDLEDTFVADFKIGPNRSGAIMTMIDVGWRNKKPVSFYDLESAIGGDRMEIYHVCRLAFLDRRFDDNVWKALTVPGSGPIETQGMTEDFDEESDLPY